MSENIKRVRPNQGNSISVVGDTYRIIIDGKDTQGAYAMIDMKILPGAGPPPHAHPNFSETFYVVVGQVEFVTENGLPGKGIWSIFRKAALYMDSKT